MTLLMLAALQMLPNELYEAARVDGINPLRVFWHITLPLIWPALMVAIIFRVLDAMRVFDVIYILTANSRETMSMSIYARQYLIEFQDVGLGSAAASLLFAAIAVVVAVMATLGRVRLGNEEAR
jgi:trehalose/maltose transport system permease protein